MTERLTEYKVQSIKPKANPFKIWDSIGRGLYLLIYPSGNKSWYVKYRINKKEKKINLGRFPHVSVKQAREDCFNQQNKVAQGVDVSKEKKLSKQRLETFELLKTSIESLPEKEQRVIADNTDDITAIVETVKKAKAI